jgi:hypothetical protein
MIIAHHPDKPIHITMSYLNEGLMNIDIIVYSIRIFINLGIS